MASFASAEPPEPSITASDPTVPDAALQQLLFASGGAKATNKAPQIVMRGKIVTGAGQGLIIVEIDKQILTLKKGVPLSLSGEHGNIILQLSELTHEAASIEVLPLKLTVRLP